MKQFSEAYLDQQYNNRLRVPEFAAHFKRWQEDSLSTRTSHPQHLNIAYGQSDAAETLDVFMSTSAHSQQRLAPVLFFIHGGYWRSLDKADHSFIAPAFTQAGACVVIPNYPLCPVVNMEQLVLTQIHALAWVYLSIARYGGDPQRITVIGHSAGGHLAAMMLACQWKKVSADLPANLVPHAMSISGLHDLAPMMHSPYLQTDLRLTVAQVKRCSPAYFPTPRGQLIAVCGGDESDEFRRQNRLIQKAWGRNCVKICEEMPDKNHFSILQALCTPGQRTHELAMNLLLTSTPFS